MRINSASLTLAACITLAVPSVCLADGPCSDDIAQLGRQLGTQPGLGAPIAEPSQGQGSTASTDKVADTKAPAPSDRGQGGGASLKGGGSAGTVGGAAGPAGGQDVATGQVATSAQDVRRQSVGQPTTAQEATNGSSGATEKAMASADKVTAAKASLQQAADLNAKGDSGCKEAVEKTRKLMGGNG